MKCSNLKKKFTFQKIFDWRKLYDRTKMFEEGDIFKKIYLSAMRYAGPLNSKN